MTPAVTKAVFADYRRVKSRKVMQVVFEMPLEAWPSAYKVLGEPSIETSEWYAIAKLQVPSEPAPTPKEQGSNLTTNAAMLIKERAFQQFCATREDIVTPGSPADEQLAEFVVKKVCRIESKRDLNRDPAAAARWRELRAEFEAWKQL